MLEGLLAGFVPSAIALVATNTPEAHAGYALGIMATSGATGGIVGPLIGGVVSHLWGNREAFSFFLGSRTCGSADCYLLCPGGSRHF